MKKEKEFLEKVCGLLLEGNFPGKFSPVVAEVFAYSDKKLREFDSSQDKEVKKNENKNK